MSALFAVLLAGAYTLALVGAFRLVRWWIAERDRRAYADFRAQQLVAESVKLTREPDCRAGGSYCRCGRDLTRDQQFREASIRG